MRKTSKYEVGFLGWQHKSSPTIHVRYPGSLTTLCGVRFKEESRWVMSQAEVNCYRCVPALNPLARIKPAPDYLAYHAQGRYQLQVVWGHSLAGGSMKPRCTFYILDMTDGSEVEILRTVKLLDAPGVHRDLVKKVLRMNKDDRDVA